MAYALVVGGTIQAVRNPGRVETIIGGVDAGRLLSAPPETGWTDALAARVGFLPITEVAKPADDSTHTYDSSVSLNAGVPTRTWTQRLKTQAELDADTETVNQADVRAKFAQARTANNNWLAIASPTNAQAIAYLDTVAKEFNGLIVLMEAFFFGDRSKLLDISDT